MSYSIIEIENFLNHEVQMKLYLPNKFGNFDRFTDMNGKQEFKDGKGIDHLTGMEFEVKPIN